MIDWIKIAKNSGLTPEEFRKEVFTVAACVGIMSVDASSEGDCFRFTCYDDVGPIEVIVRRKEK